MKIREYSDVQGHTVEFRPYKGVQGRFEIEIPHQVHVLVDGAFVGYCPTKRGDLQVCGKVPAEIKGVLAQAAERYWGDRKGEPEVQEAFAIGDSEDNESEAIQDE